MKALFHKKAALPVTISTRYHRYVHSHAIPYQPPEKPPQSQPPPPPPPLAMMPTGTLLRSLFFTSIMSSPLLNPCLAILGRVVNSNSPWLNPSQNPVVHHILRTTIYNHFCAGKNEVQVKQTVSGIKNLGFRGVILGYAKEVVVREYDGNSMSSRRDQEEANVQAVEGWKRGNLRTLKMIGKGDYLAIKFTGAGPLALNALSHGDPMPEPIANAMHEICQITAAQKSRLWIDAEQQIFQPAIDAWTIDLMREHNRNTAIGPVVFNTIQAYLKSSTENVQEHLILAQREGWQLGIKLVRGAYIAHDHRECIHDTKAETDANYDYIVERLLKRGFLAPLDKQAESYPDVRLFVASHNAETVRKACALYRQQVKTGTPTIPVEFGQLQGMADEIGCGLVQENRMEKRGNAPGVFKYLAWGTTEECLHYLLRRAVENKGAVQRTRDMAMALRRELGRRVGLL